jgi:isopenicillin-N N-acyltransferase-like protein
MTLPLIHLTGTAHEQGLQHGRSLREHIHHNINVYFQRFEQECLLSREEVLHRARRYRTAIAQQSPDYDAGMRGIAEGADADLDEIAALNVRYEIIYYQSAVLAMAEMERDGCTAFAVAPRNSANGHLLLGQNWDWIPWVHGAVLHTTEADGLETISFTEAGIHGGKIGFNSAGVGLAVNGITSTADEWTRLTEPYHLRCYQILRSRDWATAVAAITDTPRSCSANYLIAQTPDCAVDVEAAPDVVNEIQWQNGRIVHTNHFVDPAASGIEEPPNDWRYRSCNRFNRMQELIDSKHPVTIADMQHYLQDHTNPPGSICRHEDPAAPVDEQYRTVTSVVMDLHERTLYITDGPPCQADFQEFQLAPGS